MVTPEPRVDAIALERAAPTVVGTAASFAAVASTRDRDAARAAGTTALRAALLAAGCRAPGPLASRPDGRRELPAGWTGSLSHREGLTVAAVSPLRACAGLGVDLEVLGALRAGEAELVLRPDELARAAAAARPDDVVTLMWSAKEVAFKAWSNAVGGLVSVEPTALDVTIHGPTVQVRALPPLDRFLDPAVVAGRWTAVGRMTLMYIGIPNAGAPSSAGGASDDRRTDDIIEGLGAS